MVFLHINPTTEHNCEIFDRHVNTDNKKVFVLIFMEGCGPCEATKPEWKKLESYLDDDYKNNENLIIADLDQALLSNIKKLPTQPKGFPTMMYISDKGNKYEEYNKGRGVDSFVDWIKSKVSKEDSHENVKKHATMVHNKKHNKSNKYRKSNKSNKSNKYSKYSKYNKYRKSSKYRKSKKYSKSSKY